MSWSSSAAPKRQPPGFIEPLVSQPPVGPGWVHEIKHDGYRLIICRRGDRVRLFTRRGYDWTDRYPLIVTAAGLLPTDATIDGEVVVCDAAGIADFALYALIATDFRGLPAAASLKHDGVNDGLSYRD
jgi:bifunctional non-homologous end joining protein LigD